MAETENIIEIIQKAKNDKSFTLELSHKNLSSLPDEIFELASHLLELDLFYNCFESFPAVITSLTHLKSLVLGQNQIGELSNLEYLSVQGNPISTFPKSFINLKKLKSLDIRGTALSKENCCDEEICNHRFETEMAKWLKEKMPQTKIIL